MDLTCFSSSLTGKFIGALTWNHYLLLLQASGWPPALPRRLIGSLLPISDGKSQQEDLHPIITSLTLIYSALFYAFWSWILFGLRAQMYFHCGDWLLLFNGVMSICYRPTLFPSWLWHYIQSDSCEDRQTFSTCSLEWRALKVLTRENLDGF